MSTDSPARTRSRSGGTSSYKGPSAIKYVEEIQYKLDKNQTKSLKKQRKHFQGSTCLNSARCVAVFTCLNSTKVGPFV